MVLADSVMLVVGLMLLGVVGFFFMVLALAVRLVRFVCRALLGSAADAPRSARAARLRTPCSNRQCGHPNRAGARYCARCGRPLDGQVNVDAYG